jgi:DNA-binding NtrC family response regulator
VPIVIPPLRERKGDIPLLVDFFLGKYCARRGKKKKTISDRAMHALMAYDWPGNVRELESVIERATVLTENEVLHASDLMFFGQADKPGLLPPDRALRPLDDVVEEHIQEVLQATNGNISRAAGILGIDRKTLRQKVDKPRPKPPGR